LRHERARDIHVHRAFLPPARARASPPRLLTSVYAGRSPFCRGGKELGETAKSAIRIPLRGVTIRRETMPHEAPRCAAPRRAASRARRGSLVYHDIRNFHQTLSFRVMCFDFFRRRRRLSMLCFLLVLFSRRTDRRDLERTRSRRRSVINARAISARLSPPCHVLSLLRGAIFRVPKDRMPARPTESAI